MNFGLAVRLARRELRGGVKGLTIVLLCLALGVGVIAAVGSLRAAIDAGLAADSRALLGGDVEIDGGNTPLPGGVRQFLRDSGARLSDTTMMRSLLVAPSGERTLIELKAVDAAWPLVGQAADSPPQPIAEALETLIGDEALRRRLAAEGSARVRNLFDVKKVSGDLDDFCAEVIERAAHK